MAISESILDDVLAYDGEDGLRGFFSSFEKKRTFIRVEDRGILTNVHNQEELRKQLSEHNQAILRPRVRISIEREAPFFNDRLKLLLFLISDTKNMRKACAAMAISYGKAWSMINLLEQELGYFVVERTQGGKQGGNTRLTEKGEQFLLAYQQYEEFVFQFAQNRFQDLFISPKII